MEQGIVKNTSEELVSVMWDGLEISFAPGQSKVFSIGVAKNIAGESKFLEIVEDASDAPVAKTPVVKNEQPTCKKCGFIAENKGALLQHYQEAHPKKK